MLKSTKTLVNRVVFITYKNHRGVLGSRKLTVRGTYWGKTKWHPAPNFFLHGYDHHRMADRYYAMQDISSITCATDLD